MGIIFLFIFIVLFLFRKQISLWLFKSFVNKVNKQANNAFRQAQEQQQASERPNHRKKKKIDPAVGEFVNFEEIKNSEPQEPTKSRPDIQQESQVEDAIWEDIK